jgi:hypothetical protein
MEYQIIINGFNSNTNISKLTYDNNKKKNWKFVEHKDDTQFLQLFH